MRPILTCSSTSEWSSVSCSSWPVAQPVASAVANVQHPDCALVCVTITTSVVPMPLRRRLRCAREKIASLAAFTAALGRYQQWRLRSLVPMRQLAKNLIHCQGAGDFSSRSATHPIANNVDPASTE